MFGTLTCDAMMNVEGWAFATLTTVGRFEASYNEPQYLWANSTIGR